MSLLVRYAGIFATPVQRFEQQTNMPPDPFHNAHLGFLYRIKQGRTNPPWGVYRQSKSSQNGPSDILLGFKL